MEMERDMYEGGSGATGVTNVAGADRGAQLTVAERVALHEACAEETTVE